MSPSYQDIGFLFQAEALRTRLYMFIVNVKKSSDLHCPLYIVDFATTELKPVLCSKVPLLFVKYIEKVSETFRLDFHQY